MENNHLIMSREFANHSINEVNKMSIFNEFPYTNLHELNLDWILAKVKELATEWLQVHTEFETMQQLVDGLEEYIHDYFENLDLTDEVRTIIDKYLSDGTITLMCESVVQGSTAAWLTTHITNPASPPIDTSLSVTGAAADARATGNAIADLQSVITKTPTTGNLANPNTLEQGSIQQDGALLLTGTDAAGNNNSAYVTTDFIELAPDSVYTFRAFDSTNAHVPNSYYKMCAYDSNKIPLTEYYHTVATGGGEAWLPCGTSGARSVIKYVKVSYLSIYKLLATQSSIPPNTWEDFSESIVINGTLGQDSLDQIAAYFGLTPVNP